MAAFEKELQGAKGLGLRRRKDLDVLERPRKAVGNAVRRTLKDIQKFDLRLAEHLRSHLTIGRDLRYEPPAGLIWCT
jgi:hypothetical protein